MQDAPEQEQSAEAPDPAAADNAAAQETSAPEQQQQEQTTAQEPRTLDDLDRMAKDILAPEKDEKPEAKAESVTETEVEKPAEQEDEKEVEDKKPADRVRLTSLKDNDKALVNMAVQMVRDGLADDIPEAIAKLSPAPKVEAKQTEEQAEPEKKEAAADPHAEFIAGKQAEIAEIKTQLLAAKKDFNDDLETELTEKLLDLKSDLKLAEYQRSQETKTEAAKAEDAAAAKFEADYQSHRAKAVELFPDADKEGTPLFEQIVADIADLRKTNPAIFNSPNYPLLIAAAAAAKVGAAPVSKQPAARPAAQPSPNAKVAARPASPLVGGNATTASSDIKSAIRQVESIRSTRDLDALAEAVFAGR